MQLKQTLKHFQYALATNEFDEKYLNDFEEQAVSEFNRFLSSIQQLTKSITNNKNKRRYHSVCILETIQEEM